ncbi:MAG: sulfatase-like hydrolase/transferase [Hyphomicrobiaceae bacterium]
MKPANLIVIMSDEHDPRFMGLSGHPRVKTPTFDRMAATGVNFTNAYTPCPICVPARAAFATGQYVHRIRHWDNAMPYTGSIHGWGHVLQESGRRVESIGKLHYRHAEDPAGFDIEHIPMNVYNGVGMVWGSIRDPMPVDPPPTRMLGDYIGPGESTYTEYDRSVANLTVDWLRDTATRPADEPWVLYVGFVAPHFPLVAPEEFFALYDIEDMPPSKLLPADGHPHHPWIAEHEAFWSHDARFENETERKTAIAAYHALCSWVDHNVGRVLGALDETGLADTTRVIYTSDHGDNVGARGLWGKSNLYQESTAVPMIMTGPDIAPGVCHTPVDLLDLYPTILDGAGIDPAPHIDDRPGKSIFGVAAAPDDIERPVFSEYHAVGSNFAGYMLRRGKWKFHYYVNYRPELFDLDADPEETTDLAADPAHAEIVRQMEAALREICDPEAIDALAKSDQQALIDQHGGRDKARLVGAPGATPPPKPAA